MIPLRFDATLKQRIVDNMTDFECLAGEQHSLNRAAVALTVVRSDRDPGANQIPWSQSDSGDAAVILTRRGAKLNKHAGQWALPGGRLDRGENATEAALRELREEVNLDLDTSNIIARLDDYATRSGFVITPLVMWADDDHELEANPDEVASIHRIPLRELLREDSPLLESGSEPDRPVLRIPVGNAWIAAPTAAVLYQFREVALRGNMIRVDHFEQPEFAWR